MTRLADLRRRLARLRRRRQRVRRLTALAAVALAVLWLLAAAFLVDWTFNLDRLQRAILLGLSGGLLAWAFFRWSLPWLGHRETELDMALLVQRQHHIDTDLVAALQFESPEAAAWGSRVLERAVVDGVAEGSRRLNVYQGLSRRELFGRARWLAATIVVWAAVVLLLPGHVSVFFQRMLLSTRHYPTRTVIQAIAVNGVAVDPVEPGGEPVRCFWGRPVRFEVKCAGELPSGSGTVDLAALEGGGETSVELVPIEGREGTYRGELPRLLGPAEYQVRVGDAWTDPARLEVSLPPAVTLEMFVLPPDYARSGASPMRMPSGLRQISVMEGSQVRVELASDKRLREATLSVEDRPYTFRRTQAAVGAEADRWALDRSDTPLANVLAPIRYAIQVVDEEGQSLERPIEGTIRLQADAPPRIAAAVVTRYVLPAAAPRVYFRAVDDYGVARVTAVREVTRADGKTEQDEVAIYALPENQRPEKNLDADCVLDLAPLGLVKSDTVKVTLKAVDYRGHNPGKEALADPLVFEVTDEQGIFANLMEADRHSARQLKTMIQRQLGIAGESP